MIEYRIVCSRDELAAQEADPRLHRVATLARIANALRFVRDAAVDRAKGDKPADSRQRAASFFYTTGLLYEGLKFADRLGSHFRQSPAFREGFAVLLKEPRTRTLRNGVLNRLRNKAIYHHDDEVFEQGLRLVRAPDAIFMRAHGRKPSDVCYDLADVAVFRYAMNSDAPSEEFLKAVSETMVDVVWLAERFTTSCDLLIRETLIALGWRWEQSDVPTSAV